MQLKMRYVNYTVVNFSLVHKRKKIDKIGKQLVLPFT